MGNLIGVLTGTLFQLLFYTFTIAGETLTLILTPFLLISRSLAPDKRFNSIFITGASKGIGAGLALKYAKKGVHLFLCARTESKLMNVKKQCEAKGATVTVYAADVSNKEKMIEVVEAAEKEKPLDLVIANAGIADWSRPNLVVDVNIQGVLHTVYPALPAMKKRRRGHICVVSSVSAYFEGWKDEMEYAGTKSFVLYWCRSMRDRLLKKYKIGVTAVCPGLIKTDMGNQVSKGNFVTKFLHSQGLTTAECADAISYACKRNMQEYLFPSFYYFIAKAYHYGWKSESIAC